MHLDQTTSSLLGTWLTVLGLFIGSFLNVVIVRVPLDQSIVRPRSRCPKCNRSLSWYENIPVFSWLFLRGRCRSCGKPISWRYPLVELTTAGLFVACLARFGWTIELARALTLVVLLIPLSLIDLEHWLLPFSLTLPGIALGLGFGAVIGVPAFRGAGLGAVIGFFSFWALEWIGAKIFKKEALGGGDKYLLALLGAFLGYRALLGIIFLSSFQASIVGLTLLKVRGRAGPAPVEPAQVSIPTAGTESEAGDEWVPGPTNLPLGPWLALAALEIMLVAPLFAGRLPWSFELLLGISPSVS